MNCRREYTIIYWIYDYDKEGWEYWKTKEWLTQRKKEIEARENLWGGYIYYEARCSEKQLKHYLKNGFPRIRK